MVLLSRAYHVQHPTSVWLLLPFDDAKWLCHVPRGLQELSDDFLSRWDSSSPWCQLHFVIGRRVELTTSDGLHVLDGDDAALLAWDVEIVSVHEFVELASTADSLMGGLYSCSFSLSYLLMHLVILYNNNKNQKLSRCHGKENECQ